MKIIDKTKTIKKIGFSTFSLHLVSQRAGVQMVLHGDILSRRHFVLCHRNPLPQEVLDGQLRALDYRGHWRLSSFRFLLKTGVQHVE